MRSSRTPRIATWLLKQFGCSPHNEALIGDLTEEFGRSPSRARYWKQVLIALAAGFIEGVRAHKALTVRAVATGWICIFLADLLMVSQSRFLRAWIVLHGIEWLVPLSCLGGFGIGWLVGRLHRPHQRVTVLAFVGSWFLSLVLTFPAIINYAGIYFVAVGLAGNILAMISTLLGGALSSPASSDPGNAARRVRA